ncbi:alpha-D-ribose 1-methylphosphonate 5-triphosphate diphosphatase [Deinococcus sp.]|uniref:alpha-D-ribose 1-methylphosphonate 5-triphosphate diphosphatase n=1 Tax=Deinococcus sp. TaxID=47478 RepID=UPI0025BAC3BC|nr:alpha-D-ribose 1-methylphosphonate 5-triphosphate diphosphatase [Deinococcus sp.]
MWRDDLSREIWLSDVRLVLPGGVLERGSLRLEDGAIAEIVEGPAPHAAPTLRRLAGQGHTVIPGIIDLHGDMLEREVEPRPGAAFPLPMSIMELDKRLAAAGVTTAYAAISFAENARKGHIRTEDRARELVHAVGNLRGSLLVDFRIHARFDVTNARAAPILKELLRDGLVDLVSLNDHTPGQGQYRDLEAYMNFMERWQNMTRKEVQERLSERLAHAAEHPVSWDVVAEVTALARQAGLPIASHDDDTEQKVDLMQQLGAGLSEFPVTVKAAQEARKRGMSIIMGAPNALRGRSLTGNLSAVDALGQGLLDILASDYYPATLLQAAWQIGHQDLPLHEAVRLITFNPANAVGLEGHGRIAVGAQADLVVVSQEVHLKTCATLKAGRVIYWAEPQQKAALTFPKAL